MLSRSEAIATLPTAAELVRPISREGGRRRADELLLNSEVEIGAGDGLRTRYLDLGKVALYQVSYSRSATNSAGSRLRRARRGY
jgi:hypothetical protein